MAKRGNRLSALRALRERRDRRRQLERRVTRMGYQPELLEERRLLASPQLAGINPNGQQLLVGGQTLMVAPTDLTFRFDQNQVIDPATVTGIRLTRANHDGVFGDGDDIVVAPGFLGIGEAPNEVVMRFASTLPDDVYRIDVLGSGPTAVRNIQGELFNNGIDVSLQFRLNVAPQVVSVVPQPISRSSTTGALNQARNQIHVYFNNDALLDSPQSAENPAFYQLIFTQDTVTSTDDLVFNPTSVSYDSATNRAVLTFARDLDALPTAQQKLPSSRGTFRLRIGTSEGLPEAPVGVSPTADVGASIGTSFNLGGLTRRNQIISSAIETQIWPVIFPGGENEPGHRQIPTIESHVGTIGDTVDGIRVVQYNFRSNYGVDPQGRPLFNLITPAQRQRAREIMELYGYYLGIDVMETANLGLTIVTGDMRALDPEIPTGPGGVAGLAGGSLAIMDASEQWNDAYAGNWFQTAMHEIGHLLGLGHTYDLPPITVMGEDPDQLYNAVSEPIFPGLNDILHGQFLENPESIDVDMYRFQVTEAGEFVAEVIAERKSTSSHLDSHLRLFRVDGTLIAQNDDYFSEDSLLRLRLEPGIYYLGISSTGNDEYNPVLENSGANGTSQGTYDLRLGFLPEVNSSLVDATGVPLDGDADGLPGGVFHYWFQAKPASSTIYVDRANGATSNPNAPDTGNGTLANPYQKISTALAAAAPGTLVRIVGNGGADGDVSTLGDNLAYEIGRNPFGDLRDGASFNVPRDVSVMIDAGAIFKLQNATIRVGSDPAGIDRSGASLQVLGVPGNNVYFTSAEDEATGRDFNSLPTVPEAGEWGGIVFQNDVDRGFNRFDYEREGEFLNHVAHATLLYGGGLVTVNSVRQVFNPIHMTDARPTVAHNTIRFSADAAMSANPDSFEESRFHGRDSLRGDYQLVRFTADYSRVGPDVHGNRLVDNTTNGLFVRIDTPAGEQLERMTVSGRWDDADVVHVVTENLQIGSTPGGAQLVVGTLLPLGRLDASLAIDPGIIVKLDGSRIEVELGAQLLAEGREGAPVVFTSLEDDRFGAGGTFETSTSGPGIDRAPLPEDWGGIYGGPASNVSLDRTRIAYGGGVTRVEGTFAGFNAVTFYQTDLGRLANSILEFNGGGRGGQGGIDRLGRGPNDNSVVFVRAAQPVIIGNVFQNSTGPETAAISADVNSLTHVSVVDPGRSTGPVERSTVRPANRGPLVAGNVLDSNPINGMVVRGGVLQTEGVWDDTDIVHVLRDEVVVSNLHTFGGLQLLSSPTESLVVKLFGPLAGFTATGVPMETPDRIGGTVQILGQPGRPVVITSLNDNSVGAGVDKRGRTVTETHTGGRPERARPAGSFQIDLNFGPLISARPDIVAAIEMAARMYEELFEDPITVVLDVELADLPDGLLGTGAPITVPVAYDTVRGRLVEEASGRSHESIVNQLPAFRTLEENILLPVEPANPFTLSRTLSVNRANAKAMGISVPTGAQAPSSAFDPNEKLDGTLNFNMDPYGYDGSQRPTMFDYDPTDLLLAERTDFFSVVIHEMGHVLGFVSAVDDVDAALADATLPRDVEMTPWDLYRLQPGRGAENFDAAQRVLDPRVEQVFYDGGFYDSFGIDMAGITRGDAPVSRGSNFGNGAQASHWQLLPDRSLGMMDPSIATNTEKRVTELERQVFDLIGYDVVGGGLPGDWRSILFESYANDRNVDVTIEAESVDVTAPGTNATPATAQLLGELAPHELSGDENRRLGFEVRGLIDEPTDIDVYSFQAIAGTQVWIDIDRTTPSLDTIVELIDSSGEVIVRSNNSQAEYEGSDSLFVNPNFELAANPLPLNPRNTQDFFSVNTRDAGFRVNLPGRANVVNTYHVRVRSAGPAPAVASGGLSSGVYHLQIRLRQEDEKPGSTVRSSDIRFADDGIRLRGLPRNSELAGEVREDTTNNDTDPVARIRSRTFQFPDFVGPQKVGNVLASNHGTISISGQLDADGDVDLYLFQVQFENTQQIDGFTDPRFANIIVDLDYADGLAGPDTAITIFEAEVIGGTSSNAEIIIGDVVFTSSQGADQDDLPGPLDGASTSDLSRGSASSGDPFLGPVRMGEGFYVLAVNANAFRLGPSREQFDSPNPLNPFIRTQPSESLIRIVDSTFDAPPVIAPVIPDFLDRDNVVPFHLGDVTLFVTRRGGDTGSDIYTVDAFTGPQETDVGSINLVVDDPFDDDGGDARDYEVGDIAMRDDGLLFGFTLGDTDQTAGNLLRISPADATATGVGEDFALTDDTIETYDPDVPAMPTQAIRSNGGDGFGVNFEAIGFTTTAGQVNREYELFAIGNRETDAGTPIENILYQFDTTEGDTDESGRAIPNGAGDIRDDLDLVAPDTAWTQIVERGVLDTALPGSPGGRITGMAFTGQGITITDVAGWGDGVTFSVSSASRNIIVEMDTNGQLVRANAIRVPVTGNETPAQLAQLIANSVRAAGVGVLAAVGDSLQFSNRVLVSDIPPTGATLTEQRMLVVTDRGGLYEVVDFRSAAATLNYITTSGPLRGVPFSGMTAAPAGIENGLFIGTFLATDTAGNIHAFGTDGVPRPIFYNGTSRISTGISNLNGVAFSTLDRNLWHVTNLRSDDPGHGPIAPVFPHPDNDLTPTDEQLEALVDDGIISQQLADLAERLGAPCANTTRNDSVCFGGSSFYFGDEGANGAGRQNFDYPGGAHGSMISQTFDLSGYSPDDAPVLYFNYYLAAENATVQYNPSQGLVQPMRDALRVFVGDESSQQGRGRWHLVASSDPQDAQGDFLLQRNGFTFDVDPSDNYDLDVQQLYYNTYQDTPIWVWDDQNGWVENGRNLTRDRFPFREDDNSEPWNRDPAGSVNQFIELNETAPVWRQARIDLAQFAGVKDLRLRFDFSTAASFDLGRIGGVELKAIPADDLRDGDTFVIGNRSFEFELGYVLEVPGATGVVDGDRIVLTHTGGNTDFILSQTDAGPRLTITDTAAWVDGATLELLVANQPFLVELDSDGTLGNAGAVAVEITGSETTTQLAQLITDALLDANLPVATASGATIEFVAAADVVSRPAGADLEVVVLYEPQHSASDVTNRLESAINDANLPGVQLYRTGRLLNIQGVSAASVDAEGALQLISEPGSTGTPINIHFGMTAAEVAQVMRQPLADAFANGQVDVIKSFDHIVRLFRLTVTDPGPLGLASSLKGDEWGAFSNLVINNQPAFRGQNNTSLLFDYNANGELDADEDDFELPFEGAFIDDLVIGFASRGETIQDHRIPYFDSPLIPSESAAQGDIIDVFFGESTTQTVFQDSENDVTVGRYEVNLRQFNQTLGRIDPRDRLSDSLTIIAPSGPEIVDGRFFRISDGEDVITFEYEDVDVGDGVQAGNVPIPFSLDDTAAEVALTIRNTINALYLLETFSIRAAFSNGDATSNLPLGSRVNLFGNAFVLTDPAPNGIDSFAIGSSPTGNVPRGMGQMIITGNSITHSAKFGVVVEDTERDLPSYAVFDPSDVMKHSQFTIGDFTPQPGPVRNLAEPNAAELSQGPVISNNVIAFNTEGGVHFGGDANGYVIVAPLGVPIPDPQDPTIEAWEGKTFRITDQFGRAAIFEFDDLAGGAAGVAAGNIPVPFGRQQGCSTVIPQGGTPTVVDCENRYDATFPDLGDRLEEAIESTPLDVTVYRTEDELFVEGAVEVIGIAPGGDWFFTFYSPAQRGAVAFGRVVNNTIVGRGGNRTDQRQVQLPGESEPRIINDFKDIGILLEDNASPTMLNNVVVNFEVGIAADNTSKTTIIGGSLYQGNVVNSRNIGTGDFAINLPISAPLFIDFANGNFYPAASSLVIDSSINSLEDRPSLVTVKEAHGIGRSPILAPTRDALGQLRVDDPKVEPPAGVGINVFKDRGALDRADFVGPTARLFTPRDNDAEGVDKNPTETIVEIDGTILSEIVIQFLDGAQEGSSGDGTGVDPASVTADKLVIIRDGGVMQLGVDYLFNYDPTNRVIRLTPVAGIFPNGSSYEIELLDGIRDIAGNALQDNRPGGGVHFNIQAFAGADFGDAPAPYPTLLAQNGARHSIVDGFYLGGSATAENNGQPVDGALGDFGDDGVVIPTQVERGREVTFAITSTQAGRLDAWIDLNRDGDWNDPSDQVLVNRELPGGTVNVAITIPASASLGETYARFRFSSAGGLQATGAAADGEVEDYALTIVSTTGWQNHANPPDSFLDVNNDGTISPVDALRVINELNNPTVSDPVTGQLPPAPDPFPAVPGYIDVDGNGVVSPIDALRVINALNAALRAGRASSLVASTPSSALDALSLAAEPIDVGLQPAETAQVIAESRRDAQLAAVALWGQDEPDELPTFDTGSPRRSSNVADAMVKPTADQALVDTLAPIRHMDWTPDSRVGAAVADELIDDRAADELWAALGDDDDSDDAWRDLLD